MTLLFREMQPLIEAGFVYIAKPPLYRLTRGQKHRYIERDQELEDILLGDKFDRITVTDHDGEAFKLTEARWTKLHPAAQAIPGMGQRRSGPPTVTGSSRSCSRHGCSRKESPTSRRC